MIYSRIVGTGRYLPERIMTNFDLENIVETSDEWIRTRTGVERRHVVTEDQTTSDMCVEAAKVAMEEAGVDPSRDRSRYNRNDHARSGLPKRVDTHSTPARHSGVHGFQSRGGLYRLHIRVDNGRQIHQSGRIQVCAGHGRRVHYQIARLERPEYLRVVRRWRRRGDHKTVRRAGHYLLCIGRRRATQGPAVLPGWRVQQSGCCRDQ